MGIADIHIHSVYSPDSIVSIEAILLSAVRWANLDVIAITDHDQIDGSLKALDLADKFNIQVIPGEEVSTSDGHLLALFIQDWIPPGLSLCRTLEKVAEQGGICVAPHPTAPIIHSLSAPIIRQALVDADLRKVLVGIEILNTGQPYFPATRRARRLCTEVGLAPTGSSDAHAVWAVGSGATIFPGCSPADLRAALVMGTTSPFRTRNSRFLSLAVSRCYHSLLRRAGLALWTPSPEHPYQYRKLHETLLPVQNIGD